MTEKLRSGVNGEVREAIQQSVARILVGVDGSLAIEAKSHGPLAQEHAIPQLGAGAHNSLIEQWILSPNRRCWKLAIDSGLQ